MRSDTRPDWAKEVDRWLVDRHLTKKELAAAIGVNYSHLTNIMNGKHQRIKMTVQEKCLKYIAEANERGGEG